MSRWGVLEVDELHVAEVAGAVRPAALVLLNLTRDLQPGARVRGPPVDQVVRVAGPI